jgi:trehalose synthase
MQPGVVALSGWDLVGAATLPSDSVKSLLADGDTRWINRGAYDLSNVDPNATKSASGLPRARSLYGSLPEQLKTPSSFASQLKKLLRVRAEHHIYESELVDVPSVRSKGLLLMVHRLPADKGIEVTALNFGRTPMREAVAINAAVMGATVTDPIEEKALGKLKGKELAIDLGAHEGKVFLIK